MGELGGKSSEENILGIVLETHVSDNYENSCRINPQFRNVSDNCDTYI